MAKAFSINILGLSKGVHTFEFQLGESFFKEYGQETASQGHFAATVTLDKRETFIEADFKINGSIHLTCDRSLDEFDYPISLRRKIVFKYGEVYQEISDEIIVIPGSQAQLELGQLMYEFISLEIPMKKLHPRYNDNDREDEMVYSSQPADDKNRPTDPRWEVLKKLK
ncbi:MAG: DUF177 domain-containing protein [Bacteroidetes bacterium]|nr:DUF177 domain-containing protein [Bacteroidota bacterium]MBS1539786.1 DUF177 domain-containing protein [Bacteroidota bacterium]